MPGPYALGMGRLNARDWGVFGRHRELPIERISPIQSPVFRPMGVTVDMRHCNDSGQVLTRNKVSRTKDICETFSAALASRYLMPAEEESLEESSLHQRAALLLGWQAGLVRPEGASLSPSVSNGRRMTWESWRCWRSYLLEAKHEKSQFGDSVKRFTNLRRSSSRTVRARSGR